MKYKNKGPPKRSSGVLQTGSCKSDYFNCKENAVSSRTGRYSIVFISPAGVIAQAEDIIQRYIKISGMLDQDAVCCRRPVSLIPVDGSLIGSGQRSQLGLSHPCVLAQHAQPGAYGYIHEKALYQSLTSIHSIKSTSR